MSKKKHKHRDEGREPVVAALGPGSVTTPIAREDYEAQLHMLQVERVKLQRHFMGCGDKILVLVEGRDAAGKDGGIKRVVEYLSPRETRVVALGKPSDRERRGWYFQRYVAQLPVAVKHWKAYSEARDTMLLRTHTAVAPWHIVRANDKRPARLNLMRDILSRLPYASKKNKLVQPDPDVAFESSRRTASPPAGWPAEHRATRNSHENKHHRSR